MATSRDLAIAFLEELPDYTGEVLVALLPIVAFCAIFQLIFRRFHKLQLQKIGVGFVYTFLGLALFLTGVNVGFLPAGYYLGGSLAGSGIGWWLIPIGMVVGYFIVTAEPAVHVLTKQVEEITDGGIPRRAIMLSLSISVAVSVGLVMTRVITGISIYWLVIPGYLVAMALTFFSPRLFTSIAFDSGGVASGPMTTCFLLPFAMGACEAVGGNVLTDAFGVVAMVAMTPLITIQVLGVIHRVQQRYRVDDTELEAVPSPETPVWDTDDDEIVELMPEEGYHER